jgi:hypothetical protein
MFPQSEQFDRYRHLIRNLVLVFNYPDREIGVRDEDEEDDDKKTSFDWGMDHEVRLEGPA